LTYIYGNNGGVDQERVIRVPEERDPRWRYDEQLDIMSLEDTIRWCKKHAVETDKINWRKEGF